MTFPAWVRLPSDWINGGRLQDFRWGGAEGAGSANTAALMVLLPMAHHANQETGAVRITYDQLSEATSLSRAKLSDGLQVLSERGIISCGERSHYLLAGFDPARGWSQLPAKRLYVGSRIIAFLDFKLRNGTELNALKLYLLFSARRGRDTNMANISYDKIEQYSGIDRFRIKQAISFLASLGLVYVEHLPSASNEHGIANAYRLAGIDPYKHMGTSSRELLTPRVGLRPSPANS